MSGSGSARRDRALLRMPQADALGFGLLLTLVGIATMALLAPTQGDTFWQLRAGQDLFQTGRIPLTDTYSHTVAGQLWPNHSWLWQSAAYGIFSAGGLPTLTAANAILAVLAVVVAYRTMEAAREVRLLILLLSFPLLIATFSVRPQVAATLLFALLIRLLLTGRYWMVPLLFLLWANVHGSVVVGGLVLVAVGILAAARSGRSRTPESRRRFRTLALVVGLSAGATLINPLGFGLWELAATSVPKARDSGVLEFEPVWRWGWIGAYYITWSIVIAVLSASLWRRLDSFHLRAAVVIALATLPTGLAAGRNVAWAALASLPALAALLSTMPTQESIRLRRPSRALTASAMVVAALALAAVARVWASPTNALGWEPVGDDVVDAIEACPGPLYNTYNQGAYLIWWTPDIPVFIDSRYDPYPAAFIQQAAALESTGDYVATFAEYAIGCASLHSGSTLARNLNGAGWVAAGEEAQWIVLYPPDSTSAAIHSK